MKLEIAEAIAEDVGARMSVYCDKIMVAGSVRRGRPEVKDIELVIIPKTVDSQVGLFDSKKEQVRHPRLVEIIREFDIVKGDPATGKYIQFNTPEGIKIDLFTATRINWGYIFVIRTGSSEFSQFIAKRWVKWGYKGIDGNLTRDGEIVEVRSEKAMFDLLGLPVVPPTKRNQAGLPGRHK